MKKKILIPLCALLVIVLGGIGGFAIYNSQKEPEGPEEARSGESGGSVLQGMRRLKWTQPILI